MYVCLCNGLKDKEICQALKKGEGTVGKIFQSFGCKPQCGKCVPYMRETIMAHQPELGAM